MNVPELLNRLERIETLLAELIQQKVHKEWYTTAEVTELTGRAEFTVREWCRRKGSPWTKTRVANQPRRITAHPEPRSAATLTSTLKAESSLRLTWTSQRLSFKVVSPIMASLENRTGYFNVVFQFGGKKFTRSLNTDDAKEANRLLANLEQTIRDVSSGRIILPPDADIPTFLLSDGKLTDSQVSRSDSTTVLRVSLRSLFESFFVALPDDSLEESTISQMKTHRNNLLRVLGNDIIVEQSDLTQEQQHELWECLYLRMNEIDELLQYVRENALHTFHYPMIVAAAHTGARRSELMRSQLADIRDDVLIIREKKRRRGQDSTRRVPMSTLLKETLRDWKREHPGGPHTFAIVDSSNRQRQGSARSLTRDEAHNQFRCVLKESRWSVIRGWHCLRHSFISNLASNGVDQRLIDEFVGHTTEEMRRRYRHLFPDVKQAAITSVFG